jgi:N-acetylglucosamine-6-phosphate deacetylase
MKAPGLIDLQVNGYKGVDFSHPDLTEDTFTAACREVLQSGATAFLATMITSSDQVYAHNLPIMVKAINRDEFRGRLLGIHLEGPFISAVEGARGAHNPQWVRKPDISYLQHLIDMAENNVKLTTIAAELEGAAELATIAAENGIAVSLGHQMAGVNDLQRLTDAGARALTHLGNGIPLVLPRHENPIFAGLAVDKLSAMMITDGHHLPAAVIKTFIRTKGVQKCIVASDATALSGMPPGEYQNLGNKVILDKTGRIYNPKTGFLVGSSATMLDCMNHLVSLNLVAFDDLMAMAFHNPLRLIGVKPSQLSAGPQVRFDEEQSRFCMLESAQ